MDEPVDLVERAATQLQTLSKSVDSFAQIEGRTWRALRTTPLHRFDATQQRQYANELERFIAVRTSGSGVATRVQRLLGAPSDAAAFVVMATAAPTVGACRGSVTVLSTVGSGFAALAVERDDANNAFGAFLPARIALQRGDARVGQLVIEWLATAFDCTAAPLAFPPYLLVSIASQWLADAQRRPLELSYAAPARAAQAGLESLSVAVPFASVDALRAATRSSSTGGGDLHRSGADLLAALESHVSGVTHMSLASFRLERIACSVGSLGCDGRVKFNDGFADAALRSLSQFVVHAVLLADDQPSSGGGGDAKRRRAAAHDESDENEQ